MISTRASLPVATSSLRKLSRWRSAPRYLKWPSLVTPSTDRKSTRLNSSHDQISYAVFCLKKKVNHGDVFQLSVQSLNSSNNAVRPTPTVTFASSDPSVTGTLTGVVCEGIFDAYNLVWLIS